MGRRPRQLKNRQMTKETYRRIEEYMRSCMKDSAHDRDHVYRVLYTGLDIASTEPAVDYDVLIPALLLHDIGRPEQAADPSLDHAEIGARKAYAFLTGTAVHTDSLPQSGTVTDDSRQSGAALQPRYPDDKARAVAECIYTHRFRTDHRPATIEAEILFDADKVDVTGIIGIARTLQYSGAFSDPLYTLRPDGTPETFAPAADNSSGINPTAGSTIAASQPAYNNHVTAVPDEDSFLHEYSFKLSRIYDNFHTRQAAEIAASRRSAASAFHAALLAELSSTYSAGLSALNSLLQ